MMRDGNRTPSPTRTSRTSFCRERSPWTAQRVRKKGRSSPSLMAHLPKLAEGPQDLVPTISGEQSRAAMLNPFLRQLSMPSVESIDDNKENAANPTEGPNMSHIGTSLARYDPAENMGRADEPGTSSDSSDDGRTIRRVLVDSPVSSRRSSWRGDETRDVTRESTPGRMLSVEGHCQEGLLTAPHHDAMSLSSPKSHARPSTQRVFQFGSPEFALSKGHVTPNNLVPGWDDDPGDVETWPRRDKFADEDRVRSLDLMEAYEGNEVDGNQAWQDVRCGDVKPDDIDTLNALLKAFCKVKGDPEEAEQVVKEALQGGRIVANASTYHHMATLWTQHDQLNNRA